MANDIDRSKLPTWLRTARPIEESLKPKVIKMILEGHTYKDIRKILGIVWDSWALSMRIDCDFVRDCSMARSDNIDDMVDRLLEIPDQYDDSNKAKVLSENIKWIASKRKPAVYGDRIDLNVNQIVDIGAALQAAKDRIIDVTNSAQRLTSGNQESNSSSLTDCESVSEGKDDIFE